MIPGFLVSLIISLPVQARQLQALSGQHPNNCQTTQTDAPGQVENSQDTYQTSSGMQLIRQIASIRIRVASKYKKKRMNLIKKLKQVYATPI
jgi:hypothetical protein